MKTIIKVGKNKNIIPIQLHGKTTHYMGGVKRMDMIYIAMG